MKNELTLELVAALEDLLVAGKAQSGVGHTHAQLESERVEAEWRARKSITKANLQLNVQEVTRRLQPMIEILASHCSPSQEAGSDEDEKSVFSSQPVVVEVGGIWLRGRGAGVEVLAQVDGRWRIVIGTQFLESDGVQTLSHVTDPMGIAGAPLDDRTSTP